MSNAEQKRRQRPIDGLITRHELIAILRQNRAQQREILLDLPKDGYDFTRYKRSINRIDFILRLLQA